MDRSTRLILIGLSVLLVLSIVFAFSLFQSKNSLIEETKRIESDLKNENSLLSQKLNNINKEKQYAEDRMTRIQKDLDVLSAERDEAQSKINEVKSERDNLAQEVQKLKAENQELKEKTQITGDSAYLKEFFKEKADLQKKVEDLELSLEQGQAKSNTVLQDKASIEIELKELLISKEDLERQLKESQDFALRMSKQLTNEKNDNAVFTEEINRLTAEKDKLANQYQEAQNDKITLSREILRLNDKINRLEQDKTVLNRRLSEVNQSLQTKLSEIMQLKSFLEDSDEQSKLAGFTKSDVVELPPIVVRSEESMVSRRPELSSDITLVGHIIVTNADQKFVVIDLGEFNGVKRDMFFGVYRDGDEVAKLQVIETRDKISAADIKQIKQGTALRKGDIVKQL